MRIVLASASPRRKELMGLITDNFEIKTTDVDERAVEEEAAGNNLNPEETVKLLAKAKAQAVYELFDESDDVAVIGSDTSVILDDMILGKPADKEDARNMLTNLSGRKHQVITGVSIFYKGKDTTFADVSDVIFNDYDEYQKELIERYISTDEPYDKAGAYGIQSGGALLVKGISGDFFSVVGLPVTKVAKALDSLK